MSPFDEQQKDALLANVVRDRAEALFAELRQTKADAEADTDHLATLSPEQLAEGRAAMDAAIAAAQRMVQALNEALRIAQDELDNRAD